MSTPNTYKPPTMRTSVRPMLKEVLPEEIQAVIIAVAENQLSDPEILNILPPDYIRDAFLREVGVRAPLDEGMSGSVRDWVARQRDIQTEAKKIQEVLWLTEPAGRKTAEGGSLPKWIVEPWAPVLLFDWSCELASAVEKAKRYISESAEV